MILRLPFTLLGNLWRLIAFLFARSFSVLLWPLRRKRPRLYAELGLASAYALGAEDSLSTRWFGAGPSFLQLRQDIKRLRQDPRLTGVVLDVSGCAMGAAQAADLRDQLDSLRDAGKHLVAHADGVSTRELLLMSAADHITLSAPARLYTLGLRIEEIFAAPLLRRLGVSPQFIHIGAFKTATHRMHKDAMTPPQRLMMTGLQQGFTDLIQRRLTQRRDLPLDTIQQAFVQAPLEARTGAAMGLIDATVAREDLADWIALKRHDAKPPTPTGDEDSPAAQASVKLRGADQILASQPRQLGWRPLLRRRRYIGVLDLTGAIASSPGGIGRLAPGLPGQGPSIRPDEVIPALHRLRDDAACVGMIIHINSPGGSALASDLIWSALDRIGKPSVAYCSDVAASGGYYIACAADRIICRPETITGSIGVITGKVALGDALEPLGIRVEAIEQTPSSRFNSMFAPLPPEVLAQLQADARGFYRRFLERVGIARRIHPERLHRYARGRVYLGDEALARELVDDLGGMESAIATIYDLCKTDEAHAPLRFIEHRHRSLRDMAGIPSFLTSHIPQRGQTALRALDALDELAWVAGLLERERVLAMMPLRFELA
jgi:protease IV